MYEGLGKVAIDATPGAKYNPKWPSQDDTRREKIYNYLGWIQCAAFECIFVHLWGSGALAYHDGFFTTRTADGT